MSYSLFKLLAVICILFFQVSAWATDASVAILKTPEPIKFRAESTMYGGFLWFATAARNRSISDRLSDHLVRSNMKLNELLANRIAEELSKNGIRVSSAAGQINPIKPWETKYSVIKTESAALLHIYLEKVGIQSRPESSSFRPFAHVVYCLVTSPNTNECTYGDRAYYGEGYTTEDYLVYPADDSYQWADFDDAIRRISNVEESLNAAILKIAPGIANAVLTNLTDMQASMR